MKILNDFITNKNISIPMKKEEIGEPPIPLKMPILNGKMGKCAVVGPQHIRYDFFRVVGGFLKVTLQKRGSENFRSLQ